MAMLQLNFGVASNDATTPDDGRDLNVALFSVYSFSRRLSE